MRNVFPMWVPTGMEMNKLSPDMTLMEALATLAEGSPDALTAMMACMEDLVAQVWPVLRDLDELEIYGKDIWIAYNDICRSDVHQFVTRLQFRSGLKQEIFNAKVPR